MITPKNTPEAMKPATTMIQTAHFLRNPPAPEYSETLAKTAANTTSTSVTAILVLTVLSCPKRCLANDRE